MTIRPIASESRTLPQLFLGYLTSFRFLLSTAIILKMFWACRSGFTDPDIWWHLRHAEYMFQHHRLPSVDTFSFTAAGTPYLNYEWLSELVYYGAYRVGGLTGTFILCSILLSVLMLGVYSSCEARNQDMFVCGFAVVGASMLAPVGSGPRMHLLGWLLFLVMFAILNSFRYTRREKYLWLLPFIFCIWVNCHPSWFFGVFVFVVIICVGLIREDKLSLKSSPWSAAEFRKLVLVLGVSIGAMFINPFGYRLLKYPLDAMLSQQLNIGSISEWAAVSFGDSSGYVVLGLLAVLFATAILAKRSWRIDDFLLTIFVTYCGLRHIRFLILAAIVLPVILVGQIERKSSSFELTPGKRWLNVGLVALLVSAFVAIFPSPTYIQQQIESELPSGAANYLRTNPVQGNIFNWFEWGGYLGWTLPQSRWFIDSRTDIFDYKGVLRDYLRVIAGDQTYELLDKHQICYAILPKDAPITYFMGKNSGWAVIYSDKVSAILRKNGCQ